MGLLLVIAILVGFITTLVAIPVLLRTASRTHVLARATDCHHIHQEPIPRWGGLALVMAFILLEAFVTLFAPEKRTRIPERNVILLGAVAMFALGFWDDFRALNPKCKLLGQILISVVVCWCGVQIEVFILPFGLGEFSLGRWAWLVTIVWLVGMTNLINLIDGMDGLAGGISLMSMGLLTVIGHYSGNFELQAAGMAGALAGFLRFNSSPARIYLGDGGAYFLGFQVGLFSIINSDKGRILSWLVAPLIVLALPISDVAQVILRRGLRGLPIFRPDRKHIHHRLNAMGLSRRRVVISMYALTLGFWVLSLCAVRLPGNWLGILAAITLIALLLCAAALPFSRKWFYIRRVLANSLGMRKQTRYALCLKQWLELEAARHETLETLWLDFVFAAQRLGFVSVSLKLKDAERVWEKPGAPKHMCSARYQVQNGCFGILELKAPPCPKKSVCPDNRCDFNSGCERLSKCCLSDPRVFETMSDLLAESWVKAAMRWRKCHPGPFALAKSYPGHRRAIHGNNPMHECVGT